MKQWTRHEALRRRDACAPMSTPLFHVIGFAIISYKIDFRGAAYSQKVLLPGNCLNPTRVLLNCTGVKS